MKRLLAFLLAILLLTGCTAPPEPTEPQVTPPPTETEAPLGPALYRESGAVEQSTNGAVWTWPLERNCGGVLLMGNTVLFLEDREGLQKSDQIFSGFYGPHIQQIGLFDAVFLCCLRKFRWCSG